MATLDYPIMGPGKTEEQNIAALRSWAINTTDQMNYLIDDMESKIESLENQLKGDE